MPAELKGAVALRKALKQFTPDLAKETQKELQSILRPITNNARGFIPSSSPLSGWAGENKDGAWSNRMWDSAAAKRGIGFKTTPSKPNRSGFRSLSRIVNNSAAGAIYETAGRKNPNGRPQAKTITGVNPKPEYAAYYGKRFKSPNKGEGASFNPNAGKQFVDAIGNTGRIVDAYTRVPGMAGRASTKMRGRAIFRAWAEDGGKTQAAVIKAIEKSRDKFNARVGAPK